MEYEYLVEHATFKSVEDVVSNVREKIVKYRLDLMISGHAFVLIFINVSRRYTKNVINNEKSTHNLNE